MERLARWIRTILVPVKRTRRSAHSWLEHAEKSSVRSPHKCARPDRTVVGVARISVAAYYSIRVQKRASATATHPHARRRTCTKTRAHTRAGGRPRGQTLSMVPSLLSCPLSISFSLFPSVSLLLSGFDPASANALQP